MIESTLYYEKLKDKCLWVDGTSSLDKNGLYDLILSGKEIENTLVTEIDSEIEKFSKLTGISFKEKNSPEYEKLNDNFLIPKKFFTINLEEYFIKKFKELDATKKMNKGDKLRKVERIYEELTLYQEKGLEDILRAAIYIVTTFETNDVVWGPGRGSSCCSYLLYLIGIHDVDSVEFELDIDEFLR